MRIFFFLYKDDNVKGWYEKNGGKETKQKVEDGIAKKLNTNYGLFLNVMIKFNDVAESSSRVFTENLL